MHILFFIDSMSAGGKERRLTELMKALAKEPGISITLVVMNEDIHYKEVFELGIKIHYLIRTSRKDFFVLGKLYGICRESKPDIAHCWDSMTAMYLAPVCKILKIKFVNGMVVDTPVRSNVFNKLWLRARLTFPFSDLIVGNSLAGLQAYGAPFRKSVCIHNGLHLSRFEIAESKSVIFKKIFGEMPVCDLVVGMVAAFEDRKDYKTLVEGAAKLFAEKKDIYFIFVGDGKNMNTTGESIPAEIRDKFLFLGRRSDVDQIIHVFDIGILLTNSKVHGEGISNSILEYMAAGKPVIATRGGGTAEIVSDGVNGYLIDAASAAQLADRIKFLSENEQIRTELGNNGEKLIREKYGIDVMTSKYIEQYNLLLNIN